MTNSEKHASSTRRLAAILFADIVGYTSLMQSDEAKARLLLAKFRNTLNEVVSQQNGKVINYYGDGCLCTFESAVDAMSCAKVVQTIFLQNPQVPVRIGLHSGDVFFEADNVYGDSVNVASRIESLGIAGSVLFSKRIKRDIDNQTEFEIQQLGEFEFKNVKKTMTVFALANEGFVVPQPDQIKGKLKAKSEVEEGSFFQQIWKKKIPQILLAYVLLAWLGLQLFDWALNQFGISPNWAQIFFISVIGIIPSLLVYLNNRERIHQKQLRFGEKILFPVNLIGLGVALFFMFRGTELGATSQSVSFINADGVEETRRIVKEEFRQPITIFPFDAIEEDTAAAWLSTTIPLSLLLELEQDKSLVPDAQLYIAGSPGPKFSTMEKVNTLKIKGGDLYIDGTYNTENDQLELTPIIRNKKNGKIVDQRTFKGAYFPTLVDSMSIYIRKIISLNEEQFNATIDLNFEDYVSKDMEALLHLAKGSGVRTDYREMEKAIEIDSTMALAYFQLASKTYYSSRGELESKVMIDKAMKYRKKLPFQYQIGIMTYHHMIYKEWEKAEQLIKIQLEMSPNDPQIHELLLEVYWLNNDIDKLTEHLEKQFVKNPNVSNGFQAMNALLMKGQPDKVITRVKTFLALDPQNIYALSLLSQAHIHKGNYDEAKEILERITLINPDIELNLAKSIEAIEYMKTHPTTTEYLSKFVGVYRNESREMLVERKILNNQIYSRASNQSGFFQYPAGENTLKRSFTYKGFTDELLFNDQGEVYALKSTENFKDKDYVYYFWKQDSLIWKAEELLRNQDYKNAKLAYQNAIKSHPKHFYLQDMLRHLEYLESKTTAEVQDNFDRMVGEFGEIKIWKEDGLLYYKRPGVARRIFRPISDNKFTTLLNYSWIYEVEEKNGEIIGIRGAQYDFEKKEYVENEEWYFERTKLLN